MLAAFIFATPVLARSEAKIPVRDRAEFLLVGRPRTPVGEFTAGEIRPAEHFDDEAVIIAGHWRRPCNNGASDAS